MVHRMQIKSWVKSLSVAALMSFSACSGLRLDSTEQAATVPPSNITATGSGPTTIDLTWSTVANARKYYVFQSQGGGPSTYITTVLDPGTSYTAINLTPSTTYSFEMQTADLDGTESALSAPVTASTLAADAFSPTNVVATATSATTIDVTWNAVSGAFKYYVLVSQGGGAFSYLTTVLAPGASYTAFGLTPSTTYSFEIVTSMTDGTESPPSAQASATTPGPTVASPPTNVTAFAFSDSRISVQWDAAPNAAKYFVYRSDAGGPFSFVASVVSPTTTSLSANLSPDTSYCFQVTTVLADDTESAPSASVCDTTFPLGGGVFEGWWKFDEKTGTIAVDQSGFGRNATLSGGATFATTGKPPIDDDRSYLSIPASNTAVATAPAASGFDLLGSFSIMFWANTPVVGDAHFIGMRISGCGSTGWEIAQDSTNQLHFVGEGGQINSFGTMLAANTWTHVGVTYAAGTMHMYLNGVEVATAPYTPGNTVNLPLQMGHVGGCAGGQVGIDEVKLYSRDLTPSDVATLGTVPPAPTSLTIASQNSVSMNLAWTPVTGASKHIIEKGTAVGNETFYTHSPATPTFHADHLSPNTQYVWRVRTVRNGLYSAASASVVGTTDPGPTAPTNVAATVVSTDRIQVTWDAVSSAVKYYVFESVNGGAFAFKGSVVAPTASFLAVNLSPATTYAYQVQAEDSGQITSPMSASASATTP